MVDEADEMATEAGGRRGGRRRRPSQSIKKRTSALKKERKEVERAREKERGRGDENLASTVLTS